MATQAANTRGASGPIGRIVVRLQVGDDRMAGTDDPIFVALTGPEGRQFRLSLARGRTLRRASLDEYVFAAPDDPETNVANPHLNDPTSPQLDLGSVHGVAIHKTLNPIPNVRGRGELDDRLLIDHVEVTIHAVEGPAAIRFQRNGPLWLGLVAGLTIELERTDGAE